MKGGTNKSYGIQVARLAGLPQPVIDRAKEILANLEGKELNATGQPKIAMHKGKIKRSQKKKNDDQSMFFDFGEEYL